MPKAFFARSARPASCPRDPRVDQVALEQHAVLRGERGSGLTGCAYNLVAEGQAIVYPIPRITSHLGGPDTHPPTCALGRYGLRQ
jgi:hypothetical protein